MILPNKTACDQLLFVTESIFCNNPDANGTECCWLFLQGSRVVPTSRSLQPRISVSLAVKWSTMLTIKSPTSSVHSFVIGFHCWKNYFFPESSPECNTVLVFTNWLHLPAYFQKVTSQECVSTMTEEANSHFIKLFFFFIASNRFKNNRPYILTASGNWGTAEDYMRQHSRRECQQYNYGYCNHMFNSVTPVYSELLRQQAYFTLLYFWNCSCCLNYCSCICDKVFHTCSTAGWFTFSQYGNAAQKEYIYIWEIAFM